jgi:hypothetical protein
MIKALPAMNWPWARCWISASAALAILRLGAGTTPAASTWSGRKAFCGVMQASTSREPQSIALAAALLFPARPEIKAVSITVELPQLRAGSVSGQIVDKFTLTS